MFRSRTHRITVTILPLEERRNSAGKGSDPSFAYQWLSSPFSGTRLRLTTPYYSYSIPTFWYGVFGFFRFILGGFSPEKATIHHTTMAYRENLSIPLELRSRPWQLELRLRSWHVTVDWVFPFGWTHPCCGQLGVHPFHCTSFLS